VNRLSSIGRNPGSRGKARQPVDFEDWIRAQLAASPAVAPPSSAARRLLRRVPAASTGHLLQAFTAGAAVTFFALGLFAGAPLPPIRILPAHAQGLPVISLSLPPAAAPVAEASTAAPGPAAVRPASVRPADFHRRTDAAPPTQPSFRGTSPNRTGATSFSGTPKRCTRL
jgi:hypothetical protein